MPARRSAQLGEIIREQEAPKPTHEVEHRTECLSENITLTAQERKSLVDLLHTAASINRDYLRRLPQDRRGNPTEDYVGRFTTAAARLEAK